MRPFARDRRQPSSVLNRIDRLAGMMNPILAAIAVGLAMLDFIYAAQNFVDSLPTAVRAGLRAP